MRAPQYSWSSSRTVSSDLVWVFLFAIAGMLASVARSRADESVANGGGLRQLTVAPENYRAKWAVIIGINRYPGDGSGLDPLNYAVNDAREFHDLLVSEFGYIKDHIKLLTDGDASQINIQRAFTDWLPDRMLEKSDSVLVFFAGHGLIDEADQGYLAAIDSSPDDLTKTCISVGWVKEKLGDLPCIHKLILLDSCYSGSLFLDQPPQAIIEETGPDAPGITKNLTRGSATYGDNLSYYLANPSFSGMSAGRFTPVSDGSAQKQHSVFTAAILQELRDRADSPRPDRAFTFRQLATRVETRVFNALGSRQIPNWGRLAEGDGDFIFRPTLWRPTPGLIRERNDYDLDMQLSQKAWTAAEITAAADLLQRHLPA